MRMNSQNKQNLVKTVAIVFFGIVFVYLVYDHFTRAQVATPAPPVVIVQKPKLMKMGQYVTQTGNTVAFQSVDLVARIEGYLDAIKFTDGAFVKKIRNYLLLNPSPILSNCVLLKPR